jgi:hypothetical protein
MEDQAFSPSYYWAPPPPPSPVSDIFLSLPMCRRLSLLIGEGDEGGWGGAKSYREKAWLSINH